MRRCLSRASSGSWWANVGGKAEPVTFEAAVSKVTTLADGGIRITFDLPEDAIIAAALLMECKREGVVLQVTCKPS